jgi:hypothetical protein
MPNKYWIGGTGTNWSTAANWSLTSGVVNPTTVPTAADDVFFDAGSGSGTVTTTAGATCLSANFNGFIGTFNANTNWSIGTSLTFSSTMFITGTGNILKTASGGTWTFNTKTYTGGWVYHIGGGSATTIADNIAFVGSLTGGFNGTISASSPRTITIGGNFTGIYTSLTNINFVMNGSGILDLDLRSGSGNSSLIIDTLLGTITQSATVSLFSMTFTYVRGGWTSTAPIRFGGLGSANIMNNVSTIVFHSMVFLSNSGQSVTLNSDMYVTGGLSSIFTNSAVNGSGRLYIGGNINPAQTIAGTAVIEMYGSSNANLEAGTLANSLFINKTTAGVIVALTGSLTWGAAGRTLQRNVGTINAGTSTITIPVASVTINDFTFWNLTVNSGAAIIQNLLNTINNNLTLNGNAVFQGTAGWTCANLICSTAGSTITLQNLITYTTTTSVNMLGTNANKILMTSNAAGARAIWTFNGNNQSMVYVSATRIDSDLGQTIWSFGGVIALTPLPEATRNWNPGTKPETQGITFVN